MVGLGLLLFGIGVWGSWLLWRDQLSQWPGFLRFCVYAAPSGFVALLAGWVTAEVGRQPYVVYGLMRTADAASPVTSGAVGLSLIVYFTVYSVVFGAGLYYLLRVARSGPEQSEEAIEKPTTTPLVSWFQRFRRGSE